jgi:hypothetical protein
MVPACYVSFFAEGETITFLICVHRARSRLALQIGASEAGGSVSQYFFWIRFLFYLTADTRGLTRTVQLNAVALSCRRFFLPESL